MIDAIKIVTQINQCESVLDTNGFMYYRNFCLAPDIDKRTLVVMRYQCIYENLLITIRDDQLTIVNSLHKYFKGNNYSNFTLSDINRAINKIEELTGREASDFVIQRLEFAINIEVESAPYESLQMFSDFKGRPYDKMRSKSFWYGIKYPLSEYSIKIYDKNEEVKRHDGAVVVGNILRFEIQYLKRRKIPTVKNLSDLREKRAIEGIYEDYMNSLKKINTRGGEDFSTSSSRDRELYFAGQNNSFWLLEKRINNETAKKKIRKYRSIQKLVCSTNQWENYIDLIGAKFKFLINN